MFELITGEARHTPRDQRLPMLVSTAAHTLLVALVILVPLLIATNQLPEVPTVIAFVAAAPPPPPPSPPPPPPRPADTTAPPPTDRSAAPLEAPRSVEPERRDVDEDVSGVLEGTVAGGIDTAGVSVPAEVAPPPPPPPPPASHTPVRISGEIKAPALIRRVAPIYSQLAVAARVQGYVILEATVDEEGEVRDVQVLRSAHRFLDDEAILAVRQWRYSPLVISGQRVPFVLTVTLTFALNAAS